MKHFFEPIPGQLLFHYTSVEGATAILQSNTFRLSEFSMMNDPSEYKYSKDMFIEAYQNRKVRIEEAPRWIAQFRLMMSESDTMMLIGCFTEDRDDIGLWDRYADRGKGCVIGFDAIWLAERAGVKMRRVSYDAEYLERFVNVGLGMLQSQYEADRKDLGELTQLATMFVLDLYAFKDPRFRSEAEVRVSRLVVSDSGAPFGLRDVGGNRSDGLPAPALSIQRRDGRYGPTRFIDLPLWDHETQSAIKSVGLGPCGDTVAGASIQNIAKAIDGISFWKSGAPLR